jgi:hypothetical protein
MIPPGRHASAWIGVLLVAGAAVCSPRAARAQALSGDSLILKLKAVEVGRLLEIARRDAPDASSLVRPTGSDAAGADSRFVPVRGVPLRTTTSGFPNLPVNDRSQDAPGAVQSGVSIAASGRNVVAAWNDGQGLLTLGSTIGFASSSDDGATWRDGGAPLTTGGVSQWISNSVVAVNERTGTFYLAALCQPTSITNGIAVTKGTFIDGEVMWDTPRLVISANRQVTRYDQPWLAADSVSGNLYLTYVRDNLLNRSNRIDYQRNTGNNDVAWSAPATLSSPDDVARVRAPRIASGPDGAVWAAWHTIGTGPLDFFKVRRSTNFGTFFAQEVTAESLYVNFGSGAPGFNRGAGFVTPSLAVDRTFGPYRGRAYLAWCESVNFFDDPLGTTGAAIEEEPDDSPATATPFTPGQILSGAIPTSLDVDVWSFHGTGGETVILLLDAGAAPGLDAALRLLCTDGTTQLAFSETGSSGAGLIVFTIPADGIYALRVQPFSGTGAYTLYTGLNGKPHERARDHRDVFVSTSDDNHSWRPPTRVNDDPGLYDDWLPEIAVGELGRPYVMWYDWRDAPPSACGGVSSVYLARSEDGGGTWTSLGAASDTPTAWSSVVSPFLTNQGAYLGAYGNSRGLHLAWADGRFGDPDVFSTFQSLDDALVGVPPASLTALAVLDVHPNPSRGEIRVSFSLAPGGPATLALIDVAGRRVCERTVNGSATSGRRTVDLTAGARPAAGVYLVRLTRDGRSVVRRVSILR